MTIEEYLSFEETATDKHEFHDGEVLAMSGETFEHSRVISNLNRIVGNRLRGGPCQFLESNMRIRIDEANRYVHPDGSIVCEKPEFDRHSDKRITLMNPKVVFEVLSESSEGYDRGEKFRKYRQIPSLKEVVLIAQDRVEVVSLVRGDDGNWSMETWLDSAKIATIRCLPLDLPIAELYEGIAFDTD